MKRKSCQLVIQRTLAAKGGREAPEDLASVETAIFGPTRTCMHVCVLGCRPPHQEGHLLWMARSLVIVVS